MRSLQSVMERSLRRHHNPEAPEVVEEQLPTYDYNRVVFREEMRKTYKILVPQMSPLHFSLLDPVLKMKAITLKCCQHQRVTILKWA